MAQTSHVLRWIIAAPLAWFAGSSAAVDHCVGTGDEFNAALEQAGWTEETNIRLRQGTFRSNWNAPGSQPEFWFKLTYRYAIGDVHISGGWNADCSVQTLDPNLTILDGQNRGPVFAFSDPWVIDRIQAGDDFLSGKYSLTNMTLANGKAAIYGPDYQWGWAAAYTAQGIVGTTTTQLRLEHLVITGSRGAALPVDSVNVDIKMHFGGRLYFRNNVVSNNDLSADPNSENVLFSTDSNVLAYLTSNSIHDNRLGSGSVGVRLINVGAMALTNNAIANNVSVNASGTSLDVDDVLGGQNLELRNNHFGRYRGNGFAINTGTTTGDAQWTKSGVLRIPNATSVLRNSGSNSPPGGGLTSKDIRGIDRIVESTVDRGAVEAVPTTAYGPTISSLEPLNNSTTIVAPETGNVWHETLYFMKQSGFGDAQSTMECQTTAGEAVVESHALQTVRNAGLFVLPVGLAFLAPVPGDQDRHSTVTCSIYRENASTDTLTYHFIVQRPDLFSSSFE